MTQRRMFSVLLCACVSFEMMAGQVFTPAFTAGLEDHTAVIQASIDEAAKSGGGTVWIPPGEYRISTLALGEGVTLKLAGGVEKATDGYTDEVRHKAFDPKVSAIVRTTGSSTIDMFIFNMRTPGYVTNGASHVAISGGTFDCEGRMKVLAFLCARNVRIENMLVRDLPDDHAIQLDNCSDAIVSNCLFAGFTYIKGDPKFGHLTRETVQVEPTRPGAIWMPASTPVWCEDKDNWPCRNVTIADCWFGPSENRGSQLVAVGHHVSSRAGNGVRIVGNVIVDPQHCALRLANYSDVVVSGNRFVYTKPVQKLSDDASVVLLWGESRLGKDEKGFVFLDNEFVEPPDFNLPRYTFASGREKEVSVDPVVTVTLSFDDGTRDHLKAATLLEKYGWRGCFNIVTDRIGEKNHLTWEEVRDLKRRGHEIASHTATHPSLVKLLKEGERDQAKDELVRSRDAIAKETGSAPKYLCHPYIAWNDEVNALISEVGMTPCGHVRYNHGTGTKAGTPTGVGAYLDRKRIEGKLKVDLLFHGVEPGGGWKPMDSIDDFEDALKEIKARENAGSVRVLSYDDFMASPAVSQTFCNPFADEGAAWAALGFDKTVTEGTNACSKPPKFFGETYSVSRVVKDARGDHWVSYVVPAGDSAKKISFHCIDRMDIDYWEEPYPFAPSDVPQWLPTYGKGPAFRQVVLKTASEAMSSVDGSLQTGYEPGKKSFVLDFAFDRQKAVRAARVLWGGGEAARYKLEVGGRVVVDTTDETEGRMCDYREIDPVSARMARLTVTGPFRGEESPVLLEFSLFAEKPEEETPVAVGQKIIDQFLSTDPEGYLAKGFTGYKYGNGEYVCYSVASLWVNALEFARSVGDKELEKKLLDRFMPFLPGGAKEKKVPLAKHVDFAVFGSVPLEVAILTGDERAKAMGLKYADDQWLPPEPGDLEKCPKGIRDHLLSDAAQLAYLKDGYSGQTRLWIDDMYMINLLQTQAHRVTKDRRYIDRAAKEMCLYLDKLQLANGLFNHAADVPFAWGRGNGWMAAGMPMILQYLDEKSPYRARILDGYRKMMATLLKYQRANGLWGQLVDDPQSWDETSGSAMFAYAFALGVRHGWLDRTVYRPRAEQAFRALVNRMDRYGNLYDVCIGTGAKNDRKYYYDRSRTTGDPHGQAALLWLVNELVMLGY